MHKLILLGLLPAAALAGRASSPFLLRRTDSTEAQTCEELGMQDCGGCIPLDYSCCPAKLGGCAADMVCVIADDGQDGCCPDGYTCTGNGGVTSTTFAPKPTATATGNGDLPMYSEVPGPTLDPPSPTDEPTSSASTEEAPTPTPPQDAAQPSTTGPASSSETASEKPTVSTTLSESASDSTSATASSATTSSTGSLPPFPANSTTTPPYGTGTGSVIVVTETIAVSTTICPPVVESPPLPTPTTTIIDINPQGAATTTVVAPVIKPGVVCPGHGEACHPVIVDDGDTGSAIPIPSHTTGVYHQIGSTGTGGVTRPSKTGQAVVTAGASSKMVGGVRAAVVVGVAGVVAGYL
ncbi:hypothetical protein C8A01DRAFT_38853 [Parachaetomium inaequale]|uniref:GPI anchored serine-threonine rich protein n=1 Tax=Parachaetomium inaequale TaxID=2588326 RepID=A0AAN6SNZ6_9PEZI|nr:hypothetical protein C8A01DRAFT_38853 [Parachaetomium inaequale]